MNIHPLVQLVVVVWFFATVGVLITRNHKIYEHAALIAVLSGIGWLILKLNT